MQSFMRAVMLLALGAALLSGCGDDGDNGTGPEVAADVMVVHASPDAPPIDFVIDGRAVLTGFAYPNNTNYEAENSGNRSIRVVQSGTSTALIDTSLPLQEGRFQTIVVTGMAASPSLLHITDDLTHPAAGNARVRFVHLSPDAGAMDLGFQGQGALAAGHGFRGFSPFVTVPVGPQTLEARAAGTTTVVETVGINVMDQAIYTIVLRGLVSGSGGQALTLSVIGNK